MSDNEQLARRLADTLRQRTIPEIPGRTSYAGRSEELRQRKSRPINEPKRKKSNYKQLIFIHKRGDFKLYVRSPTEYLYLGRLTYGVLRNIPVFLGNGDLPDGDPPPGSYDGNYTTDFNDAGSVSFTSTGDKITDFILLIQGYTRFDTGTAFGFTRIPCLYRFKGSKVDGLELLGKFAVQVQDGFGFGQSPPVILPLKAGFYVSYLSGFTRSGTYGAPPPPYTLDPDLIQVTTTSLNLTFFTDSQGVKYRYEMSGSSSVTWRGNFTTIASSYQNRGRGVDRYLSAFGKTANNFTTFENNDSGINIAGGKRIVNEFGDGRDVVKDLSHSSSEGTELVLYARSNEDFGKKALALYLYSDFSPYAYPEDDQAIIAFGYGSEHYKTVYKSPRSSRDYAPLGWVNLLGSFNKDEIIFGLTTQQDRNKVQLRYYDLEKFLDFDNPKKEEVITMASIPDLDAVAADRCRNYGYDNPGYDPFIQGQDTRDIHYAIFNAFDVGAKVPGLVQSDLFGPIPSEGGGGGAEGN